MGDNSRMIKIKEFAPEDVHCVVMLDFDGVTHPYVYTKGKQMEFLPQIEEIFDRFEGLYVVISSDWRKHYPESEIAQYFSERGKQRILGQTPDLTEVGAIRPSGLESYVREAECQTWMRAAGLPMTPWIAIDDQATWFSPTFRESRLIWTKQNVGFTPAEGRQLQQILSQYCDPSPQSAPAPG